MNFKRAISIFLILACTVTMFAACKPKEEGDNTSSGGTSSVESDSSDPGAVSSEPPTSSDYGEQTVDPGAEEVKKLLDEDLPEELKDKVGDGFTTEKAGESGIYNVKDSKGNTVGSVVVVPGEGGKNKPVAVDTGKYGQGVESPLPGKDLDGNGVTYYLIPLSLDPARDEIGAQKGGNTYRSVYTSAWSQYSPALKTEGEDTYLYVTDGGSEIKLCKVVLRTEMGEYFVELDFLESVTQEQREKYTTSMGEEGYTEN